GGRQLVMHFGLAQEARQASRDGDRAYLFGIVPEPLAAFVSLEFRRPPFHFRMAPEILIERWVDAGRHERHCAATIADEAGTGQLWAVQLDVVEAGEDLPNGGLILLAQAIGAWLCRKALESVFLVDIDVAHARRVERINAEIV